MMTMRSGLAALAALSALGLAGCGMSNPVLREEHLVRAVVQDDADDTVTKATLAVEGVAVTEYSRLYTLTVRAPAGEYLLKGRDSSGGRYFASTGGKSVSLAYSTGLTTPGAARPDSADGGVYVDAAGAVSLYWFWDSGTNIATRVRAPGVAVAVRTEIDPARRQARLAREERERIAQLEQEERERLAKARQLEVEEARLRAEKRRADLKAALADARKRDRVQCAGAQCERAFAQAQAYLLKQADMRIQVATPTLIETYNGTSDGQISIRLLRVPAAGAASDRWDIVLSAWCRDERASSEELCLAKLLDAYSGFLPHMQRQ